MKINYLKINGFGKIKNKEIELNKNINIIYGKNEQGKSTLLKFISGIFFGMSKNKNGKEIPDFDKYKPWDNEEYSGKVSYELNNGETYEVFRDFTKKNPQIYNNNYEDISKNFNIDKNKGNEFFFEQTNIDEISFNSTALIEQKEVILNEGSRRSLIQKMSNIINTGEENTSYKKTTDKLNKKLVEEIGNERTVGRPFNIVQEKLKEIKSKIQQIENEEENKTEINNKKNKVKIKLEENKNKINLLKEIKKIKEINNIELEKIKIKDNLIIENKNKINNIELNINNNKINKTNKKTIFIFLFLFILNILNLFLKINLIIKIILLLFTIFYFIFNLIIYLKEKNKNKINKNKINKKKINDFKNEINTLKKITEELKEDTNKINTEINLNNEKTKKQLLKKYQNTIESEIILNYFNNNLNIINEELKTNEEEYNNLNFEQYQIEIKEKDINKIIEEKLNLNEQLQVLQNEEQELIELKQAIELAKQVLEVSYNKMKEEITPKFTKNLSQNTQGIIEGKYKNIKFSEQDGLKVELENGEYINANLLSVGTIDQLYLALRLSVLEELAKESMPIILDEVFAYYDDERLENILKYLNNNFKNNQIILFTCSNREKEIMEKLNIDFKYIEL